MIITVDFDGTLTRPDVQAFVKECVASGYSVYILTSRHTEKISNKLYGHNSFGWNTDIIKMGTDLGVDKIYFTNGVEKCKYIVPLQADIHLDDDGREIKLINENTKAYAVNVKSSNWRNETNSILKSNKNKI